MFSMIKDKKNSEVTIMIQTFNRANYLVDAIDSALAQTYPCDVIVCDHGSQDSTPEVVKRYEGKVKYIRRDEDFGPHFAWLDGVLHAETKYVKILFDDDWIEPTFVEETLRLMKDDVSCVITNAKISHEQENKKRVEEIKFFNKTGIFNNFFIKNQILLSGGVISPSCCLFRKEELVDGIYQGKLLKKGGNYYHGVGPDMFVMLLGFLRYKKIGFINDSLAIFRAHEKSITINASQESEKKNKIRNAYEDTIEFYSFLRLYPLFKIFYYVDPRRLIRLFVFKNRGFVKSIVTKFTKK